MPLPTTYSGLQTQIADWLVRDDLVNQIPEFIGLAELLFNRELRLPLMERNAVEPIRSGGTRVQLPDDFLEARSVWLGSTPTKMLEPVKPDEVYSKWSLGGTPGVFSVVGSSTSYLAYHFDFFVMFVQTGSQYPFRVLVQSGTDLWALPANNESWDFQSGDRIVFGGDGGDELVFEWGGFLSSPPPYGFKINSSTTYTTAELKTAIGDRYGRVERQGIGLEMIIGPTPNEAGDLNLIYFAKIPALSDSNASNWLLTEAGDVYLYGSLLAAAPYLKDDERVPVWAGLYRQAIDSLRKQADRARYSGGQLRMRHDISEG